MTSLSLAVVLQASIVATGADTYTAAHKVTTKTGQPMVVLVGAEWCSACVEMKEEVLPQAEKRGLLRKVVFASVNVDRQRRLSQQLTGGGPIPQLLMFRRTAKGWKRRKLVGGQSIGTVESFINQGMALDKAAKKIAVKKPERKAVGS